MALTKIINDGDELVFDFSNVDPSANKQVSVILVKRCRPANVLEIRAHRSIEVRHIKKKVEPCHDDEVTNVLGSGTTQIYPD